MKTVQFCRYFITSTSVLLLLALLAVFSVAPLFWPIDYDQSIAVVKQTTPVFLGYLGQCCYYIVSEKSPELALHNRKAGLLLIVTIAPFAIFATVLTLITIVFFASNSPGVAPGTGMAFSRFTDWMSILLGVFAATASIITAWLFREQTK